MFIKFIDKCRYSYDSIVFKEFIEWLLDISLLSLILEIIDCLLSIDIRLLYVVCDFRGSINLRIKFKWMLDYEYF